MGDQASGFANGLTVQDEISTGLDSSTTFQIVKYLGDLTHTQKSTALISLLQPAPESYNLFDDVMLIAEGESRHFSANVRANYIRVSRPC